MLDSSLGKKGIEGSDRFVRVPKTGEISAIRILMKVLT